MSWWRVLASLPAAGWHFWSTLIPRSRLDELEKLLDLPVWARFREKRTGHQIPITEYFAIRLQIDRA